MSMKAETIENVTVDSVTLSDSLSVDTYLTQLVGHIDNDVAGRKGVRGDSAILVTAIVSAGIDASQIEMKGLSKIMDKADKSYQSDPDAWQYFLKRIRDSLKKSGIQFGMYAKKDALHGSRYPVDAIKIKQAKVEAPQAPRNGQTENTGTSAAPIATPIHGVTDLEKHIETMCQSGITREQIVIAALAGMADNEHRDATLSLAGYVRIDATPAIEKAYVSGLDLDKQKAIKVAKAQQARKAQQASKDNARKVQHSVRVAQGK